MYSTYTGTYRVHTTTGDYYVHDAIRCSEDRQCASRRGRNLEGDSATDDLQLRVEEAHQVRTRRWQEASYGRRTE